VQHDRALWYGFSDDVIFAKLEEPFFEMNTEKLEKIKADLARSRSWLEQIRITLYNKKAVISMSRLGKKGKFGNQIFQYSFLKLYAKEHDLRLEIPSWIGKYLFGHDDPPISQNFPVIEEQPQPYENSESLILTAKEPLKNVDFLGWFQFHTSYHRQHKKYLLSLFQPVPEIAANMKGAIDYLKMRGKTIVCLHLRRGDYHLLAPHQSFFTIAPNQWYIEWLEYIWASLDHPVLYIASDDIENVINDFIHYHPLTIKDLNTELPEAPFYPDFFILTQCDILAISNSTFSFSAALLNQRAKHFFRPDFIHEKLVSFDPWDSKPLLWFSGQQTGEEVKQDSVDSPVLLKSEIPGMFSPFYGEIKSLRVVALMTVRNEELYLERCLEHLYQQGIETCLIDNGSTDRTLEIAHNFLNRGVCRIEILPFNGIFELTKILKNEERLATEIEADWFIHHDADEIRQAPLPYQTLLEGIGDADRQGYNAINFDEFVFLPTSHDSDFTRKDYEKKMIYYYFFEPNPFHPLNAWKKMPNINLSNNAGHRVEFTERNIFPVSFILRHYIVLSRSHAIAKYGNRNHAIAELKKGWMIERELFSPDKLNFPELNRLKKLEEGGIGHWDRSDPWRKHEFFGHSQADIEEFLSNLPNHGQ